MVTYVPRYASGQILVMFLRDVKDGDEFARGIGSSFGYELLPDENDEHYVFAVPEGEEELACRRFERLKRLVDYACRRDLKLEERCAFIDGLEQRVHDFFASEDPDRIFNRSLLRIADDIRTYVKQNT